MLRVINIAAFQTQNQNTYKRTNIMNKDSRFLRL